MSSWKITSVTRRFWTRRADADQRIAPNKATPVRSKLQKRQSAKVHAERAEAGQKFPGRRTMWRSA
jgi:hypothetical protein